MSGGPAPQPGATSGTAALDALQRREAARALLAHPFLSAATHPEEHALVRRHASALRTTFAAVLGYPLVVDTGFARLVKAPLSPDTRPRPARRGAGAELSPRGYAYLALVCAGLLAPEAGEQVLLSWLVEQLRADAAACGIHVDDGLAERRHLVAAVELLVSWGVLSETDGSVAAWHDRSEEALLTVHRALLAHLLAQPVPMSTGPAGEDGGDPAVAGQPDACGHETQPGAAEQPRRALRRKLVENPLVRREDLTAAEADVLARERADLARMLGDAFGLVLEVRAEGALAYDPDEELSDVLFPGPGTVRQAALLLLDAVLDTLRPDAATRAVVSGREVPGVLASWQLVEEVLDDLADRNARAWAGGALADRARMRQDVVALLEAVSLATPTTAGLVIAPAAARYRPEPTLAPPRGRPAAVEAGLLEDGEPLFSLDAVP